MNLINPEMLILAREWVGLTQSELAEAVRLTQATISRYESGLVEIPHGHLALIARHLSRPESFFFWRERLYNASCLYHRKQSRLTVRDLKRIHARVNVLRIQATRLLEFAEIETHYRFHRLDVTRLGGPEAVSRKLRQLWQLPTGPIRSMVDVIERAGGIVFRCPFGTRKVWGISQWPLDTPDLFPVFFLNEDASGDRQRWTLAHEMGHVAMHHLPTDEPEAEANRFANEFLMPADEIAHDLGELTLQKAAALKSYWKVSMQAIICHSHNLGRITDSRYRYLFQQLNARGYRKCEPVPLPTEEPRLFNQMIGVFRDSQSISLSELSAFMGEPEERFRSDYWHSLSGLRLVG